MSIIPILARIEVHAQVRIPLRICLLDHLLSVLQTSLSIIPPQILYEGVWQVNHRQTVPGPTKVLHKAVGVQQAVAKSSHSWRLCHRYYQGPAGRLPNEVAIQIAEILEHRPAVSARRRASKAWRCPHKDCSHYSGNGDLKATAKHKQQCIR